MRGGREVALFIDHESFMTPLRQRFTHDLQLRSANWQGSKSQQAGGCTAADASGTMPQVNGGGGSNPQRDQRDSGSVQQRSIRRALLQKVLYAHVIDPGHDANS